MHSVVVLLTSFIWLFLAIMYSSVVRFKFFCLPLDLLKRKYVSDCMIAPNLLYSIVTSSRAWLILHAPLAHVAANKVVY